MPSETSERVLDPKTDLPDFASRANIKPEDYERLYQESIEQNEAFWDKQASRLDWFSRYDKVLEHDFANAQIKWFLNGKLNAAYNCIDRHLSGVRKNKAALIWEGDNPDESRTYTYQQLHYEVSRFANVLKSQGVKKGDRVIIYMPMIPELAFAVLACARIGAVHSVIFGGFSPDSILDRIRDCRPRVVVTSDAGFRGGKIVEMKSNVDAALSKEETGVERVIVVRRVGEMHHIDWTADRDVWYHELLRDPGMDQECLCEEMDSEDPLFILYTSGSTGKPKGVLHTTGGYLVGTSLTHELVFDHKEEDTYWCTADIGWITGHSYILYGPLANGATSIMFEGVPTYPDAGRFWQVVEKYQVNIFYTAPTAIRALMKVGTDPIKKYSLKSLRLLGTVGEPINPEAWEWYFREIGKGRCPIVDTYWQTETGGVMLTPLPGVHKAKPGAATAPFLGIEPVLVDENGKPLEWSEGTEIKGNLCFARPWPSMMRTVYGDHKRFFETYFSQYPGYYFTGDGARRDKDGAIWVTGRVDDVLNVSGHRIGSAEVESALVGHKDVAEAAVVGFPHDIKGQGIYAYVTLKNGVQASDELKEALVKTVADQIGKIARPDIVHWAPGLPKTRSGKIMRRILRKIAEGEFENLGDITTLADPSVVEKLIDERKKH